MKKMKCCEYDNRSVAKVTRCQDYKNVGFFVTDHSKLDCMSLTSFKASLMFLGKAIRRAMKDSPPG